jgi:2-oxoisovalerate dehydrogenase E1 component
MFLEHKHLYRQTYNKSAYPGPNFMIPFGKAKVVREGSDVTVVTYGATVQRAITAANAVVESGISVEVVDLRTLSPWDRETVFDSVKRNSRVIVAYEDSISWGYGAEISAAIADECFAWLDAPVRRIASTDTFVGYAPRLEEAILPQVEDFKQAYLEIVKF